MPIKELYLDCETTGTDPKKHGLIQIACVWFIDNEQAEPPIVLEIQPFPNDVIEDVALEVNGVTKEELFSAPRITPDVAYKTFMAYMLKHIDKYDKQDKAFFCAYRAQFDSDFIREWMAKNGDPYYGSLFWVPPLCSFMLAGFLLKRWRHMFKDFKLKTLWEFLYPELRGKYTEDDWHDAMFDISRTIDVVRRLRVVASGKWKPEEPQTELPLEHPMPPPVSPPPDEETQVAKPETKLLFK